MNPFQLAYNKIKAIKTPLWYKALMKELQDIIISIVIQVGKEFLAKLETKILEVQKLSISNEQKFNRVYNYGRELLPTIKESFLNLIIEILVSRLKSRHTI